MIRARARWLVPFLILPLVLSACNRPVGQAAPSGTAPVTKLTAAYSEITFLNLPLWIAKDAGIFEKNRLDVDVQQIASSNAIAALLSGQVQVAHAGGSEAISAAAGGADLVVIGVTGGVYPYYLMTQSSLNSPEDLRGKKVGVSQIGSSSDIATRVILRRLGLDPDTDVTIVPVGSLANRTAALLNGSIDAGVDQPPGYLTQVAQGLKPLVDLASLKIPAANNTIVVQRSFTDGASKDVAQRYVDSIVEASARMRSDKAYAIQVLKKYYDSTDDDAMEATYEFTLETTPEQPFPRPDQFTDALDQLAVKNEAIKSFDLSKFLISTFVQSAVDRKLDKAS